MPKKPISISEKALSKKPASDIENIREDLNSLKDNVIELTKHIQQNGLVKTEHLKEATVDQLKTLKESSVRQLQEVEQHVKDKPTQSVAIAFLAGLVASVLLGSGRS